MAKISDPNTAKQNAAKIGGGGRGWSKRVESAKIKEQFLKALREGYTVSDSCRIAGWQSLSGYKYARSSDEDFRFEADKILSRRGVKVERERAERGQISFPAFSEKYLKQKLFNHQLQWYDLLEGRPPRNLHPSQRYDRGDQNAVIINTPPEHCAVVETPIFTLDGWKTVGDLTDDDWIFLPNGLPCPILEVEDPFETDVFEVEFGTGDKVTTDADHVWHVQRSKSHAPREMTTRQIMEDLRGPNGQLKWRVVQAQSLEIEKADLPLDPYIFGYWLGDGETGGSRFAVSIEDLPSLESSLSEAGFPVSSRTDRDTYQLIYPRGLRSVLRLAGLMDCKHIPDAYFVASHEQRLALLQGLLDSDGTCSAKDGRVKFAQDANRTELNLQVYRLIASLGFQPRMKTYQGVTEISFKPDAEPVFRLERKARKQFTRTKNRRTDFKTIKSVTPAGRGKVRCLSVADDMREFLIGDGLTVTRNSKSTTITMNYVTYRICMDPSVRILIVSKTQGMAKKFLNGIKARLTSRRYSDLIREFAPTDGFDGGNAVWRQDMIYVNQETSEDGVAEKDPTVEALGIGGQIYGARADIIIVDDGVTLDNVGQVENQIDWVQQEVMTRLGAFGRIVIVGTRVAPVDLYVELANPKRYPTGESPWTYLTQPAVLEMGDDPAKWVTLWPKSNMPMVGDASEPGADGLYDYWTGPRMLKVRNTKQPRTWAMVYMQQQVDEQAVFPASDVQGCVDGSRSPGRLHPDREGGPAIDKNQGEWYIIAGMDPATVQGFTAITIYGFNRRTQKRRVIDVVNARLTPDAMVNKMKDLTIRFDVDEWRVEKNAFQAFLTQTKEVVQFMASRGVLLREHTTGRNKHDSDFGVSAMAMLFRNHSERNNMISLPAKTNEGVRALIEQLVIWAPDAPKTQKTDAVMSLWFAELRARELVGEVGTDEYVRDDGWLGANDREAQEVISIDQYLYAQRHERLVGF